MNKQKILFDKSENMIFQFFFFYLVFSCSIVNFEPSRRQPHSPDINHYLFYQVLIRGSTGGSVRIWVTKISRVPRGARAGTFRFVQNVLNHWVDQNFENVQKKKRLGLTLFVSTWNYNNSQNI